MTISTPPSKDILNRVILGSVIGSVPSALFFKKNGITEPFEPMTLPYLTTENLMGLSPLILLAATNNLSEVNLVAPYRLIGAQALSVDKATTRSTLVCRQASTTFWAPPIFVLMHSSGLYSAIGTCFIAAAWIT